MFEFEFQKKKSFTKRKSESQFILKKYPDRVPVIVESNDVTITRKKFLVPNDSTIGHFLSKLKKDHVNLQPHEAIFLFIKDNSSDDIKNCKNILAPVSCLLSELYSTHKSKCGFLYIQLCKEQTFG